MRIYLDNSATTRQYDEVTEWMVKYMKEDYGNPSSLHGMGLSGEKAVKTARKQATAYLEALGASGGEIIFTSGGTEADNLAVAGSAAMGRRRGRKIITTVIEHPAILEAVNHLEKSGFEVALLPVNEYGIVNLEALEKAVDDETLLISVMTVNNEVGALQPMNEIRDIRDRANKKYGKEILLHTDAVQAPISKGGLNIWRDFSFCSTESEKNPENGIARIGSVSFSGYDMISISGHKLHGPKGVGALYVRKGLRIEPVLRGGGQEGNLRSGTENVPAIAGFGKAMEIKLAGKIGAASLGMEKSNLCGELKCKPCESNSKFVGLKSALWKGISENIDDIVLNGPDISARTDERGKTAIETNSNLSSESILNVSFLGVRGEVLLHTLEQDGIFVSTGSACSSNKKGRSHVLKAMGKSDREIEGAIRFSFGDFNTVEEMEYVTEKVKIAVAKFRKLGSFR